jgi:hypothetical protein
MMICWSSRLADSYDRRNRMTRSVGCLVLALFASFASACSDSAGLLSGSDGGTGGVSADGPAQTRDGAGLGGTGGSGGSDGSGGEGAADGLPASGGSGGTGGMGGSGGSSMTLDSADAASDAGIDAPTFDSPACNGPNPAGVTCLVTKGQCVPSDCLCSGDGVWMCTLDCRGGIPMCDAGTGGAQGSLEVGAPDGFRADGTRQTDGAGGAAGTGGSTAVPATGGTTTATGGTTKPITTGAGGVAGTTGTTTYEPLCSGLLTGTGAAPTKNGICTDTDPQLCYKTCGPQSIGFKSETCTAGVYVEQAGCSFPPGDYSCYKIPAVIDPSCPVDVPQGSTPCSVAPCTLCNVNGGYLDSSGAARTGYCVCPPPSSSTGTAKWSCATTTAWPCPAAEGC